VALRAPNMLSAGGWVTYQELGDTWCVCVCVRLVTQHLEQEGRAIWAGHTRVCRVHGHFMPHKLTHV
jgi:hypothetical protein